MPSDRCTLVFVCGVPPWCRSGHGLVTIWKVRRVRKDLHPSGLDRHPHENAGALAMLVGLFIAIFGAAHL